MRDSPVPQSKYATSQDWQRHKDIIKKLYIDENKTLRNVREFMEREHGFFATDRMYKTRLKAWGIAKNTRNTGIVTLAQRDLHSLLHYMYRAPPALSGQPTPPSATSQALLSHLSDYIHGSFESGTWVIDLQRRHCFTLQGGGDNWLRKFKVEFGPGVQLMADPATQAAGLMKLNASFATLKPILVEEQPLLLPLLFHILFNCERVASQPGLSRILRHYLGDLAGIVMGKEHPVSQIWTELSRQDLAVDDGVIEMLCHKTNDLFQEHLGPDNVVTRFTAQSHAQQRDVRLAQSKSRTLARHRPECPAPPPPLPAWLLGAKLLQAPAKILDTGWDLYVHSGREAELRVFLLQSGLLDPEGITKSRKKVPRHVRAESWFLMGLVETELGNRQGAIHAYRETIRIVEGESASGSSSVSVSGSGSEGTPDAEELQPDERLVLKAYHELEFQLRMSGDALGAQQAWEELAKRSETVSAVPGQNLPAKLHPPGITK